MEQSAASLAFPLFYRHQARIAHAYNCTHDCSSIFVLVVQALMHPLDVCLWVSSLSEEWCPYASACSLFNIHVAGKVIPCSSDDLWAVAITAISVF